MSTIDRSTETERKLWLPRAEGYSENGERLLMGIEFLLRVMRIDCGDGYATY